MPNVYHYAAQEAHSMQVLLGQLAQRRAAGDRIVTTNGCFDLLHPGHIRFLQNARELGDLVVVGLNSDASVRRLKGAGRPLISENDRADQLLALRAVDYVVIFDDALPNDLLAAVQPHIHCKAGDYHAESLPEASVVRQGGGEIRILPLVAGFSTSLLVERAQSAAREPGSNSERLPADNWRTEVIDQLMYDANLVRQTAYAAAGQIVALAECIAMVLRQGGQITVCDSAMDIAFVRYAADILIQGCGPEWAKHIHTLLPDGRDRAAQQSPDADVQHPGLLIVFAGTDQALLPPALANACRHSSALVKIGGLTPSLLEHATITITIPEHDAASVRKAQLAMLPVVSQVVKQALSLEVAR